MVAMDTVHLSPPVASSSQEQDQQPRSRRKTSSSSPRETKINISSLVVYNFTRDAQPASASSSNETGAGSSPCSHSSSVAQMIQEGHRRLQAYIRSYSNSSSPICRICHESDSHEKLVSPCYCSGTMGLVHVSCMERWLSSNSSDSCELCYYKFKTYKTPKSLFEWLKDSSARSRHQRSLVGDGICFAMLTPLAAVSAFLCIEGAHQQIGDGNRMEAGCLVALSSILAAVYFLWTSLTVRFYYRHWKTWQLTNHNVRIVCANRRPTSNCGVPTGPIGDSSPFSENNNNIAVTTSATDDHPPGNSALANREDDSIPTRPVLITEVSREDSEDLNEPSSSTDIAYHRLLTTVKASEPSTLTKKWGLMSPDLDVPQKNALPHHKCRFRHHSEPNYEFKSNSPHLVKPQNGKWIRIGSSSQQSPISTRRTFKAVRSPLSTSASGHSSGVSHQSIKSPTRDIFKEEEFSESASRGRNGQADLKVIEETVL